VAGRANEKYSSEGIGIFIPKPGKSEFPGILMIKYDRITSQVKKARIMVRSRMANAGSQPGKKFKEKINKKGNDCRFPGCKIGKQLKSCKGQKQ